MPAVRCFLFSLFFFLFVSPSKFKRVSEHLQTSASVGGAKCYSGASTTPTCVGRRSSFSKTCLLLTHMHICMHAHAHTHKQIAQIHAWTHETQKNTHKEPVLRCVNEILKQRETVKEVIWLSHPGFCFSASYVLFVSLIYFDALFSLLYLSRFFLNQFCLPSSTSPHFFDLSIFPYISMLQSSLSFSLYAPLRAPVSSFHHTSSSLLLPSPCSPSPPLSL